MLCDFESVEENAYGKLEKKKSLNQFCKRNYVMKYLHFSYFIYCYFFCEKVNLTNFMSFPCIVVFFITRTWEAILLFIFLCYILRKCAYNCNFTHSSSVCEFNICTEVRKNENVRKKFTHFTFSKYIWKKNEKLIFSPSRDLLYSSRYCYNFIPRMCFYNRLIYILTMLLQITEWKVRHIIT